MARGGGEHRHNGKLGSWKIKLYKRHKRVSTVYYVELLYVYQDILKKLVQEKYKTKGY